MTISCILRPYIPHDMKDLKYEDGGVEFLNLGWMEQGESGLGARMIALFVIPSKPGLDQRLGWARAGRSIFLCTFRTELVRI